jgi:phenylacetate-CoA ligase
MNWRKHAFLLAHDCIGSRLRGHYREFLDSMKWSRERLESLHRERLDSLLRHAAKEIPYYRERVSSPELSAFPILRKEDIHAHFEQMMEPLLLAEYHAPQRPKGYSWVEVKTGGTTGTPTTVIHDADFRDWGRAGRLFSQSMCGFPIGTPFFMLWGSMRDINDAKDSLQKRVLNSLLQVRPLNAFLMDAARMTSYAKEINESSIDHLMAYVDAAYQLARFIEKSGSRVRPIKSVMACAGTVTDEFRATLSRVFGARVHNKYGSRECTDMACECAAGGFHIYSTGVHIEIVDDRGEPVPAGTTGRILVTLLQNRRFPIIRYEIGDIGALSAKTCPCGSPLPLLERVEGRISEVITSAAGTYVSPVFIRHVIGVTHNDGSIERFQFVQTGEFTYTLAMQVDAALAAGRFEETVASLRRDLEAVLGAGAKLDVERIAEIPPGESGKFQYVRNLHRGPRRN